MPQVTLYRTALEPGMVHVHEFQISQDRSISFCLFQLANWWDNAAYFDCRSPVVITTSPGLSFPKVPFTGKVDHLK